MARRQGARSPCPAAAASRGPPRPRTAPPCRRSARTPPAWRPRPSPRSPPPTCPRSPSSANRVRPISSSCCAALRAGHPGAARVAAACSLLGVLLESVATPSIMPLRRSPPAPGAVPSVFRRNRYASVTASARRTPSPAARTSGSAGPRSRPGRASHRAARDVGSAWCRLCQDSPQDSTASHHTLPERSRDLKGRLPTAWQIELIDQVTWCSSATRTSEPQKNAGERAPPGHRHQTADQRRAAPARAPSSR